MKQKVLVLAKSYKTGGRCVAGKIVDNVKNNIIYLSTDWIRPIPSNKSTISSVPDSYCVLQDNITLTNLDVIELDIAQKLTVIGQPENTTFSPTPWKKITSLRPENIFQLSDNPNDLWLDANTTSNKSTPNFVLNNVKQSLYLIKVQNFKITLSNEINPYDGQSKKEILASFTYNNQNYENFSITCPATRKMLKNQYPESNQPAKNLTLRNGDDYILCVSLGPEFHGLHYKFVASIFDKTGYLQGQFNS